MFSKGPKIGQKSVYFWKKRPPDSNGENRPFFSTFWAKKSQKSQKSQKITKNHQKKPPDSKGEKKGQKITKKLKKNEKK